MPDSAFNNQYGYYEYERIVQQLSERGYTLYAEQRPYGTDVEQYSWQIAKQIDSLLKENVLAKNITIVGTGKGALIAMLASAHIRHKDVRLVVLSGCNKIVASYFHIELYGTILSIHEKTDDIWVSCQPLRDISTGVHIFKEVELNTGLKNGYLYKPLDEWLTLVYDWVEM